MNKTELTRRIVTTSAMYIMSMDAYYEYQERNLQSRKVLTGLWDAEQKELRLLRSLLKEYEGEA